MEINFGESTIQAAIITVIGSLIAAAAASWATYFFTNRNSLIRNKKQITDHRIALKDILENLYLKSIKKEIEYYKDYHSKLMMNKSLTHVVEHNILEINIFNHFSTSMIIDICNKCQIQIDDFLSILNHCNQLNKIALFRTEQEFGKKLKEIQYANNLSYLLDAHGCYNSHTIIQSNIRVEIIKTTDFLISFQNCEKRLEYLVQKLK